MAFVLVTVPEGDTDHPRPRARRVRAVQRLIVRDRRILDGRSLSDIGFATDRDRLTILWCKSVRSDSQVVVGDGVVQVPDELRSLLMILPTSSSGTW